MTSSLFAFSPHAALTVEQNLARFIQACRDDLTVFGADLPWDLAQWPGVCRWSKLGVNGRRRMTAHDVMSPDFLPFAKAYFRYQQGHKPIAAHHELMALRALEHALCVLCDKADPTQISLAVLDVAAHQAQRHYAKVSAYKVGLELERLATFVSAYQLCHAHVSDWRWPLKPPQSGVRTGRQADAMRQRKLPSDQAMDCLAEIFANGPTDPRDIMTSSTWAMMMCVPSRVHEIVLLSEDLEVTECDSQGKVRYGWRYFAGKGYGWDVKWIPDTMVAVAQEAISRIRALTAPARALARWLESSPSEFYRHAQCPNVGPDEPLTIQQACQALGLADTRGDTCRTSLRDWGLRNRDGDNTLLTLWKAVMQRQPPDFPYIDRARGLTYSHALFAIPKHLLHQGRRTSPVLLDAYSRYATTRDMGPVTNTRLASIFVRHGYHGAQGAPIKVTTHQARHLLNTIAQKGGLSQLDIAKWSGRATVTQNRVYNHISEQERVAQCQSLDLAAPLLGAQGAPVKANPVSLQTFNTRQRGMSHVTAFGYCTHDFTMSPCEKYRDCLNCVEQVCIKGEAEKLTRLQQTLTLMEQEWEAADAGGKAGEYGADRWRDHHLATIARLRQLIAVLTDPQVEEGAVVILAGERDGSHLARVMTNPAPSLTDDRCPPVKRR